MRILVFGGSGLIGTPTCRLLTARGFDVATFSRSGRTPADGVEALNGDISVEDDVNQAVRSWRPDVILQLAATLQRDAEMFPQRGVATNVVGATNVYVAAAKHSVRRVIFGSSIAAYGERSDLMHEDDPVAPSISIYGIQKSLGEMLGNRFGAIHGFEFAALRYSGVFGPGEVTGAGMSLARNLIIKTANGRNQTLDFVSGDEKAHLTFSKDAAEATVRALIHPRLSHAMYNIGGPPENYLSLKQLHAAVGKIIPTSGAVTFTGKARSAGPLDTTRTRTNLGFSPMFDVDTALRKILLA